MVSSGAVCQPAKGKKTVRVYGRQERDKTDVVKEQETTEITHR